MFSESQVKVILILLDNNGHAGWELAEHIEMNESNLNPVLKKLEKMGIISNDEVRDSTKPISQTRTKGKDSEYRRSKTRSGEYKEHPYYLNKSLEALRIIIRELKGKKYPHIDAGFILNIILRSKYLEALMREFGVNVNKCATEEINKDFPFTNNEFYKKIVDGLIPKELSDFKDRPQFTRADVSDLLDDGTHYGCASGLPEIEVWYNSYLKRISPNPENNMA